MLNKLSIWRGWSDEKVKHMGVTASPRSTNLPCFQFAQFAFLHERISFLWCYSVATFDDIAPPARQEGRHQHHRLISTIVRKVFKTSPFGSGARMVILNTYPKLSNIVHTDFELDRVIQTVVAVDPGITLFTDRPPCYPIDRGSFKSLTWIKPLFPLKKDILGGGSCDPNFCTGLN